MISPNTYEELYEILSYMDKLTVMKIPEELLNTINKRRNPKFQSRIDKNDIFNKHNMSEETIDLLCYIDYNYWMDQNKKAELDKILKVREKEAEQEKREKYSPDNLFKKENDNTIVSDEEKIINTKKIVQYKESLFRKIWNNILSILKK